MATTKQQTLPNSHFKAFGCNSGQTGSLYLYSSVWGDRLWTLNHRSTLAQKVLLFVNVFLIDGLDSTVGEYDTVMH